MSWDPGAARERSEAELERHGLQGNPSLPLLGDEDVARLRPVEDVVARCRALFAVLVVVDGGDDAEEVAESLEQRGLTRWLASEERAYLADPTDERCVQLTWRTEGMLAMAWALNLVDELPLTGTAEGVADAFEPIDPFGDEPPPDVRLRSREELAQRLDTFYCAHWCVRHHELEGEPDPWPEEIEQGAVWERRLGLEFLFGDEDDWDQITLDT